MGAFQPLLKTFVIKPTTGVDDSLASPVFVEVQNEIHQKSLPAGVEVQIDKGAGFLCFPKRSRSREVRRTKRGGEPVEPPAWR